jgi:hypothetical protein
MLKLVILDFTVVTPAQIILNICDTQDIEGIQHRGTIAYISGDTIPFLGEGD